MLEGGLVSPSEEGTPQGGPLSPLLSNIVLDELDQELEKRGHKFARYADDCNIYVRSERAGQRVMESLRRFITTRLRLRINENKSAVARPHQRKFLGFSFTSHAKPRRRIASTAVLRFKKRIREITDRTRGRKLDDIVRELNLYLNGWRGYFGFCETRSVLKELDGWIRRRLRAYLWKQWKTVGNAGQNSCDAERIDMTPSASLPDLRARGRSVKPQLFSWLCGMTSSIRWALSASGNRLNHRTAVCGPACTVVWAGENREVPPYPDRQRRAAAPRLRGGEEKGQLAVAALHIRR